MKVSYDFELSKVVFDYSGYDDEEREVLEIHQISIPDTEVFYVWKFSGVDQYEFTLVDKFEDKRNEILKHEREMFKDDELQEEDLFEVPGMRMNEDTEEVNGFEINKKHYSSIYDDGYFDGWTEMTFRRL